MKPANAHHSATRPCRGEHQPGQRQEDHQCHARRPTRGNARRPRRSARRRARTPRRRSAGSAPPTRAPPSSWSRTSGSAVNSGSSGRQHEDQRRRARRPRRRPTRPSAGWRPGAGDVAGAEIAPGDRLAGDRDGVEGERQEVQIVNATWCAASAVPDAAATTSSRPGDPQRQRCGRAAGRRRGPAARMPGRSGRSDEPCRAGAADHHGEVHGGHPDLREHGAQRRPGDAQVQPRRPGPGSARC